MIKKELVQKIVEETGLKTKDVKLIVETTMETIKTAVAEGEKVTLVGYGTFEARDRKEKKGTDPSSGKKIIIEAKKVPYFKPSKEFKGLVNKK